MQSSDVTGLPSCHSRPSRSVKRIALAVGRDVVLLDHLRLDRALLVLREQRVIDHVAVVADDVGGGPDRIEDLQVRMHHRAQGRLGKAGVAATASPALQTAARMAFLNTFIFSLHVVSKPPLRHGTCVHLPIAPRRSNPIRCSRLAGKIGPTIEHRTPNRPSPAIAVAGAAAIGRACGQNHQARSVRDAARCSAGADAWISAWPHHPGTSAVPARSSIPRRVFTLQLLRCSFS